MSDVVYGKINTEYTYSALMVDVCFNIGSFY